MNSRALLPGLLALVASGAVACSDSDSPDAGPADAGFPDAVVPDSGEPEDAGVVDTGPPPPCLYDQGGPENRGCDPGFVCNIRTGECVEGVECTSNRDCLACSDTNEANRIDCGHGYTLTSWCDPSHGNVCTRSRAPCEPCDTNSDCGLVDIIFRTNQNDPDNPDPDTDVNRCIDYGDEESYCGRPFATQGCPPGFVNDAETGQCIREAGCAEEPVFCPEGVPGQVCVGTEQICFNEPCSDIANEVCVTNDLPFAPGICLGTCQTNADCPPDRPICNRDNGLCGAGCTLDSCAPPLVCHVDGQCAPPCMTDDDCTMATDNNSKVYGSAAEVYCNLPGRPAPRLFKGGQPPLGYRDENSCAPLGCERATDCPSLGVVCDPTTNPPECVPGCYTTEDDCRSGDVCKSGPQGNYDREGCRALPNKTNDEEIGVCCFPGCTDRRLQCDLGEFCCAEPGSPYDDGSMCEPLVATATVAAEPGQCFDAPVPPFCVVPDMDNPCDSGWVAGYNSDTAVMGGIPFQEQEYAFALDLNGDGFPDVNVCGVTCAPEAADDGCPRGWPCRPLEPGCFADADCGAAGLTCINADTANMIPGQCKCGENGVEAIQCPTAYGGPGMNLGTVANPRCKDPDGDGVGDMVCTAAYNCVPSGDVCTF